MFDHRHLIFAAAFVLLSHASGQALNLTCNPAAGPTKVGVAYSTTCTVSGGTPPTHSDSILQINCLRD